MPSERFYARLFVRDEVDWLLRAFRDVGLEYVAVN